VDDTVHGNLYFSPPISIDFVRTESLTGMTMSYLLNFTKPLNPREGVQKIQKKLRTSPLRAFTLNIVFVCVSHTKTAKNN